MLSRGYMMPESIWAGKVTKKPVIMACCWVRAAVEMRVPTPTVAQMKTRPPMGICHPFCLKVATSAKI